MDVSPAIFNKQVKLVCQTSYSIVWLSKQGLRSFVNFKKFSKEAKIKLDSIYIWKCIIWKRKQKLSYQSGKQSLIPHNALLLQEEK